MRLTTTIPAAGVEKAVKLTGRSVIVEAAGIYSKVIEVPKFDFNPGGNNNPIYPRSVYVNSEGVFNSIVIKGTAESDGEEVTFYTVDECLTTDLNIDLAGQFEAVMGETETEVLSGTVFSFSAAAIQNADGKLPKKVYLASSDNPIHYSFDVDPDDDTGTKFYKLNGPNAAGPNTPVPLEGIDTILKARFINEASGTDSILVYTFEY